MLENGKYPLHLKNRIRGGKGHLSNKEALDLFITHRSPFLSHVLLSHLSKENNSPEIAGELFLQHANNIKITVASRYQCTEVFTIATGDRKIPTSVKENFKAMQLALFE